MPEQERLEKSFSEIFEKADQLTGAEKLIGSQESAEKVEMPKVIESIEKAGENFPVEVEAEKEKLEAFSRGKVSSEAAQEVVREKRELMKKREYWEKFLNAILAEKLAEDPVENSKRQAEKILEETIQTLLEIYKEELKSGDATGVVNFFKKTILPLVKKRDPEVNENEYWDRLHAKLIELAEQNEIKDFS